MIRISVFSLLLLLGATLASPHPVLAADGGQEVVKPQAAHDHDKPFLLRTDPGAGIWNLVIFGCVFLILSKFAWPHIIEGLAAREEAIRDDLRDASRAKEEANTLLKDYESKLDDAQTQVQAMLAEARSDAEQVKQKVIDEAKAEADRQKERAISEIASAKSSALSEVASQSSVIALQLARQVVGRELNEDDHADLIRKSLDSLPSNN